jgi:hypothetical protein
MPGLDSLSPRGTPHSAGKSRSDASLVMLLLFVKPQWRVQLEG